MVEDWDKKKVTILGLGRSGIAAAKYLSRRGARVFVSESGQADDSRQKQAEELESDGIKVELGGHSAEAIKSAELFITSPGIKPQSDVIALAQSTGKEVICDIELAWRETRTPIIAITGTNGKSTTTALTSFLLQRHGKSAPACGNFGVPILSQLESKHDFLVAELSSYQLHYCSHFAPFIAVWLNLTPDHLEWHGGLQQYIDAKQKMFENQSRQQHAVLSMDDPIVAQAKTRATIFPFSALSDLDYVIQGAFVMQDFLGYRYLGRNHLICHRNDLQIIGQHNIENALASISAAVLAGVPVESIQQSIKEFKALEHRLEYVATIDGVPFYNDSKATNTDSAIKAMQAFPNQKLVLIAGGRDKGTALGEFVQTVRKHASAVILLGEAKARFDGELRSGGVENIYSVASLEEAVALGQQLKLGPVLLSPACASFDMFKDFEDRGRVFKDCVRTRLEKVAPSA